MHPILTSPMKSFDESLLINNHICERTISPNQKLLFRTPQAIHINPWLIIRIQNLTIPGKLKELESFKPLEICIKFYFFIFIFYFFEEVDHEDPPKRNTSYVQGNIETLTLVISVYRHIRHV